MAQESRQHQRSLGHIRPPGVEGRDRQSRLARGSAIHIDLSVELLHLRGPIGTSKRGKMRIATSTSPLHPADVIPVQVSTSGIFCLVPGADSREQGFLSCLKYISIYFLITEFRLTTPAPKWFRFLAAFMEFVTSDLLNPFIYVTSSVISIRYPDHVLI